jgi:hypothetical protein
LDKTPAPQRLEGEQNTTSAVCFRWARVTIAP